MLLMIYCVQKKKEKEMKTIQYNQQNKSKVSSSLAHFTLYNTALEILLETVFVPEPT